jgi:hypothetical protein
MLHAALPLLVLPLILPLAISAAEVVPPVPAAADPPGLARLIPSQFTVTAGEGGTISLVNGAPSELRGGVQVEYESVSLSCDHLSYWQSPLAGAKAPQLERVLILAGPKGADPQRVIFDTRATRLPAIGFRGLLTPGAVEIQRQPLDPAHPGMVQYQIHLQEVGDFVGEMRSSSGWSPHAGWAETADLAVVADIVPEGLGNPRFQNIILQGRPAKDGQAKRPARLVRLRQALAAPQAVNAIGADAIDMGIEGSTLTIEFDEAGRVLSLKPGLDGRIEGNPSLDMPVEKPPLPPDATPRK